MKSVVLVKQVQEAPSVQGEPGGPGTVVADSQNVTNPYDLFAVEEALRTKEKHGGEVIAMTLGGDSAVESLREALAMGADRVIHLKDPAFEDLDAAAAAAVIAEGIRKVGDVDLVFTGRLTIDSNTALTGPVVARRLGVTLLTEVFKVDAIDQGARSLTVERLLEGGLQTVKAKLPALVAVTKDLNHPRYPSLLGIRKASKAPVTEWGVADVGAPPAALSRVTERRIPPARPAGQLVQGEAGELADRIVATLADGKFL